MTIAAAAPRAGASGARRATAMTIAGSDSGGGAGIQADLKTFAAHDVVGTSVVCAITAQNTVGVRAVHAVPAAIVAEQIDAVMDDIGADAVKIGMLATAELVCVVAERLRHHRKRPGAPWIVLDPVMVATSGDRLLEDDAVEALVTELMPLADVVTPNLPEAAWIVGSGAQGNDGESIGVAPSDLARQLRARVAGSGALAESAPAILVKGGHAGHEEIVDLLLLEDGTRHEVRARRIETECTHGTGCTLSAAIAARLARGAALLDAVDGALAYLRGALVHARPIGEGGGGVEHFWQQS